MKNKTTEKDKEKWYEVHFDVTSRDVKCVKALSVKDAIKKLKVYHKTNIYVGANPRNYKANIDSYHYCGITPKKGERSIKSPKPSWR